MCHTEFADITQSRRREGIPGRPPLQPTVVPKIRLPVEGEKESSAESINVTNNCEERHDMPAANPQSSQSKLDVGSPRDKRNDTLGLTATHHITVQRGGSQAPAAEDRTARILK